MAATINDVHVVDFILESVEDPQRAVNTATDEGWTPAHFAGFLNNFDSLNLLLEAGADLSKQSNVGMSVVDEIIRVDNADLFECIFPIVKNMKRDLSKVSDIFCGDTILLIRMGVLGLYTWQQVNKIKLRLALNASKYCLRKPRNRLIRFAIKLIKHHPSISQYW